jgi:trimeric autotransporter adhesin
MVSRTLVAMMTALCFAGCGGGGGSSPPPPAPVPPPPAPAPPPPAPTIASLTPAGATAAGSNFVLTVTGTGFVATSVINWNGSARTTTFVNSTNLQAPIPASDIATAGSSAITVVNAAADGGTSSATTFAITNPAPTISSVSPTFVVPGGPQFVLTVNGAGFVASSVVLWNGTAKPTTFVSATQLTTTIPATDIATQGSAQVAVFNATPGGGTSSEVTVLAGNPVAQISQLVPSVVRPGGAAFSLTVAGSDFITGAEVTWNGAALPTTFVSATELQVAVAATDIATADSAQVAAVNPAPGGGPSNLAALTIAPFGVTERLSVATDGSEANNSSDNPSMSANGRFVAFSSSATNLVPGDTNGVADIFVRDTCFGVASGCTPTTERISVTTAGVAADGASSLPSISTDGRYVAFESTATNLVPGDTNGGRDIFVRDTCASASGCTPTTIRVSVSADGSQGNLPSFAPSISGDGRFVSFISGSILVLGDINTVSDAFVRDTCAGASGCTPSTIRISTVNDASADQRGVGADFSGTSMGANGRYVGFVSYLRCQGCNVLRSQVYVFDTCAGAAAGCAQSAVLAAEYGSSTGELKLNDRSLSANGRFVAFRKNNTGATEALLADSCIGAAAGCTISSRNLTSSTSAGTYEVAPTLTADGRFGSFGQAVGNSVASIFAHDTCIGAAASCLLKTLRISESDAGVAPSAASFNSTLSADGSRDAFASDATNLVAGDANARRDIFLARTGLSP